MHDVEAGFQHEAPLCGCITAPAAIALEPTSVATTRRSALSGGEHRIPTRTGIRWKAKPVIHRIQKLVRMRNPSPNKAGLLVGATDVGSMGNCGRGGDTATQGGFVLESRFDSMHVEEAEQAEAKSILQRPLTNSFVVCPSLFPRVFGLTMWPRMGLLP
jgi:hypothetical protein